MALKAARRILAIDRYFNNGGQSYQDYGKLTRGTIGHQGIAKVERLGRLREQLWKE